MSTQTMSPNDLSDKGVNHSTTKKCRRRKYKRKNWLCDRCGSLYSAKEHFVQHLLMHTCPSNKPYKCEFCHLGFQVPSALRNHRRVHQNCELKCEKCDIGFTRKHNYLGHILIHEGKEPFKCDLCGDEFPYKSLLKYHMRTHTGEHFACEICNKQFFYKSSWIDHMKLHCTNRNLTREHCQKSNENEGTGAMRFKLYDDRDQCGCNVCEIMHKNGRKVTKVKKRPAPHFGFLKLFSCTECSMKFYAVKTLKRHMESKHKDKSIRIKPVQKRSTVSRGLNKEQREKRNRRRKELREQKNQFVCGYMKCKARFLNEEMLNTHKLIHTRKKFTCGLCSKKFTTNINLKYHMMEHSGKYECEICGAILKCVSHLRKHERQHFKQETHPYSCCHCDRLFKHEVSLRAHLKCHLTVCKYCLLEFTSDKDLENHLTICKQNLQDPAAPSKSDLKSNTETNEGKKVYECDICDISYLSPTSLAEHVKEKHKADQFKCGHCDKVCRGKKQLEKHVMTHIQKKKEHFGKYECEVCGTIFSSRGNMMRHKTLHFKQNTGPYSCSHCDLVFEREISLRNHVKRHSTICKYCLLVLMSEKELENHLTICKQNLQDPAAPSKSDPKSNTETNEGKKVYECDVCDMSYLTPTHLAEHVKEKHKADQFKCGHCDKVCRGRKQLEKHVMTHIQKEKRQYIGKQQKLKKPYRCNICNCQFSFEVGLLWHQKSHKGIIQLTCQKCNAEFSDVEEYVNHQPTHGDLIKPFQCGYCNISFCSESFLFFHMRTCKIKKLHTRTIIAP